MNRTVSIKLELIKAGEHDMRLALDEETIEGLVISIPHVGLLYPILVKEDGDNYIVLDGHTRLEAYRRLGRDEIECTIAPGSGEKSSEIAFAGNFFRKELTPVELAAAINDVYKSGTMTIEQIAIGFHRSKHWVESMMAICGWPADVQRAMHEAGMSVAAASNLACVTDDVYRDFLIRNAIEGGVTARTTAAWLQAWRTMQPQEEAIQTEPVPGKPTPQPQVPQAPCFICSTVFPINEMSHVPLCGECIKTVRSIS